jgi:hypothetical protein
MRLLLRCSVHLLKFYSAFNGSVLKLIRRRIPASLSNGEGARVKSKISIYQHNINRFSPEDYRGFGKSISFEINQCINACKNRISKVRKRNQA